MTATLLRIAAVAALVALAGCGADGDPATPPDTEQSG